MAAGSHGGYYNEFRENEVDVDVAKREIPYSKVEYERLRISNNLDYERGRNRVWGGRDRGRVRQKDVKEREFAGNGGNHSASSKSDSGGSDGDGGLRHREYPIRVRDREPGELSSDSDSEETNDLETNGKYDKGSKIEELAHSHSPIKKRKFSPIVWDRDDRRLPTSIPLAAVESSTPESNKLQAVKQSPGNKPVDLGTDDCHDIEPHVGLSSSPLQKDHVILSTSPIQEENIANVQNAGQAEDEDYVPAHNIRSSRWANEATSPVDEGELSDVLRNNGIQRRRSVSFGSGKQSLSPKIGEFHREGSEGVRARSFESENGYSIKPSSSDDYPEKDLDGKDYMEIDEDHGGDGASFNQSDTDSEGTDGSPCTPQPVCPPQRSVNMLQGCRSVDEFERLNKIDEGTYGVVYRAKDKKTGEVVALKKVKMEKEREGFPLTSLREINVLLSFHHPSVIDVKEVVIGSNLDSIFMVMEYMEHDLKALMETMKQPFSQSEVKCLMLQLLEGTKYLHDNWVLHRDLKTSNLLLNNRGELKICDFGLARQYGSPLKPYTHLVVTLWYRAPELLLGAKQYSTAIDLWSLGCIMAELLSKQALFNGKTEFDQLDKIFKTLGTPNELIWPGFSKLPGVKLNFVKHQYNLLRRKFPATSFTGSPVLSDAGFDLLNKLLTYDPEKRITAEAALNHEWFREVPLPKSKDFMPTFPAHHAQDRRARRVMKSPDPLEELRRKELQQSKLVSGGLFG